MNTGIIDSEINFAWRLFAKTISNLSDWGFDRLRVGGSTAWHLVFQVRRPDGSVLDTQYFANSGFEHTFSFDLSENINNEEYEVYIAGTQSTRVFYQIYSHVTGYSGTYGRFSNITYFDLTQLLIAPDGQQLGQLRFDGNPVNRLICPGSLAIEEFKIPNCSIPPEDLADALIALDNGEATGGTFDYSGNPNPPAERALTAYNNLKDNKGWALPGEVPSDALSYDEDLQDVLDYADSQNIIKPSLNKLKALNDLVLGLKIDGLYSNFDSFLNFAYNDINLQPFSRICFKRLLQVDIIGSLAYHTNGFKGNGANGMVNTKINHSTIGGQYTRNAAGRGLVVSEVATNSNKSLDGQDVGYEILMLEDESTNQRINSSSNTHTIDFRGIGLKALNRLDATNLNGFNKATKTTTTSASKTLPNATYQLFSQNGQYSDVGIAMNYYGAALTDIQVANLRSRYNSYLTAIGLTQFA